MPAGTEITTSGRKMREHARRLADKIREHRLRDVVIGDHAILQRPIRDDLLGRPADHFLRFGAHREHRIFGPRQGDDRRFVDDESPAGHKNDGVRRSQINADFLAKHTDIKALKSHKVKEKT